MTTRRDEDRRREKDRRNVDEVEGDALERVVTRIDPGGVDPVSSERRGIDVVNAEHDEQERRDRQETDVTDR